MSAAPDEVVVAVAIDVVNKRGNARVAGQLPLRVPLPAAGAAVLRRFEPTTWADDVAAAVAVDIAKADAVAGHFERQVVPDETRLNAAIGCLLLNQLIPGG